MVPSKKQRSKQVVSVSGLEVARRRRMIGANYEPAHKYLIFDRDAKFSYEVIEAVRSFGSKPVRTSFRSPWQNGVAERWVGVVVGIYLDHVVARQNSDPF
jgi:hypothetical protein